MNYFKLKQDFIAELFQNYEAREAEQIFFLVLEDVFSISRIDYALKKQEVVSDEIIQVVKNILHELKTNKPIQHILGYGYCYERRFKVTKNVLVPRQETEELINLILQNHRNEDLTVLDIGTGTGCIPISLKLENPSFKMLALDISEHALTVAKENAETLGVDICFLQIDILKEKNWNGYQDLSLDIIVSNPPYVRYSEKAQMHKNVLGYDPELALFVDDTDPLVYYRVIILFASEKLKYGGVLYFEINEAFGEEVVLLLSDNNFSNISVVKDLQGKDRIVYAKKKPK